LIFVTEPDLPDIENYIEYLKTIWESKLLTNNGPLSKELEIRLKSYLDVDYLSLVSNGTLGLQIALKALNLKGEVITTPFTFAATTNVLIWEGLKPIFADIEHDTFNIDPNDIENRITKNTSAILAVHIFGNSCSVEQLEEIAHNNNIKIIYDAAHAFTSEYNNKSVLSYGDVSVLSFHATKIFNTAEGGAVVSSNPLLHNIIKKMRAFGSTTNNQYELPGINAKMNEFQAALGLCNLNESERNIELRKDRYKKYINELYDISHIKFQKIIASRYNYSYMPILFKNVEQRERIFQKLSSNNIICKKYFSLTSDFKYLSYEKYHKSNIDLPVAQSISERILCLPLYPSLEYSNIETIISIIKSNI
jgi:dTDP-4-amino-4,6-dideoxygalactose transaminase